jgi:hypothetical protein
MRCAAVVVLVTLGLAPSASADERPARWLVRATPGFGYASDAQTSCSLGGRMFVGGFSASHSVAPGVLVGAATTIAFNYLLEDPPCGVDGGRLAMGIAIGPVLEWYPSEALGLHVVALAGYSNVDASDREMQTSSGLGGTVGVGYEWVVAQKTSRLLVGVRAQLTALHTWTGTFEHTVYAPSLVSSFSFD